MIYFSLIAAANVTELALPDFIASQAIDNTVIAWLAVTEFISVLEHAANFGLDTPKRLLGQLKKYKNSKENTKCSVKLVFCMDKHKDCDN